MVLGACALATGVVSADSPEPYQWLFQDSATSTAQVCVCYMTATFTAQVGGFGRIPDTTTVTGTA